MNLTAVGGDSITWVSNGNLNGGAQTNGPILEATSVSGPISITVAAMIGTQPTVTYGINAVSTGGGAVNVTNTAGNINVNPAANAVNPQQLSAIRAISTGGNGAVTFDVDTALALMTDERAGTVTLADDPHATAEDELSQIQVDSTDPSPV